MYVYSVQPELHSNKVSENSCAPAGDLKGKFKSLDSVVGTIFQLGQSNCDATLSEWSRAILPRQSWRF